FRRAAPESTKAVSPTKASTPTHPAKTRARRPLPVLTGGGDDSVSGGGSISSPVAAGGGVGGTSVATTTLLGSTAPSGAAPAGGEALSSPATTTSGWKLGLLTKMAPALNADFAKWSTRPSRSKTIQ